MRRCVFVRLRATEWGIRCLGCGANVVAAAIVAVVKEEVPEWRSRTFYELSARGTVAEFLNRYVRDVTLSEYFDDVQPGESRDGILCQDVQALSFADGSFDVCTCSEVFEHVPDDRRGFREIRRVLRPGGCFVFTVPIDGGGTTVERASSEGGEVVHNLLPEYHDDPLRGFGRALVYRDYGPDIVERLTECGFREARLVAPESLNPWAYTRQVVVARR